MRITLLLLSIGRSAKRFSTLILMGSITLIAALACYLTSGVPGMERAVETTAIQIPWLFARIACALVLAGFVQLLLPRDWVQRRLGGSSGWTGLFTATVIGAITIGGPMTSFPVVATLVVAGADIGCVVAFVLSWSLFGIQRLVVWEFPLLGIDFAAVRIAITFVMPVLVGWWVRQSVLRDESRRAARKAGGKE